MENLFKEGIHILLRDWKMPDEGLQLVMNNVNWQLQGLVCF